MATTTLPKTGLNKQDEGDVDWETALNTGFDNFEGRIGKSYAGDPNGNVAADWLLQTCYDSSNDDVYLATTIGTAGSAVWVRVIKGSELVSQGGNILEQANLTQNGGDILEKDQPTLLTSGFQADATGLGISSNQTSVDAQGPHIRKLTVNADTEIQVPVNQTGGFSIIIVATNDSTGGYSLTFASGYTELASNLGYDDAADAVNIIQIIGDGSNVWYSIVGEA